MLYCRGIGVLSIDLQVVIVVYQNLIWIVNNHLFFWTLTRDQADRIAVSGDEGYGRRARCADDAQLYYRFQ